MAVNGSSHQLSPDGSTGTVPAAGHTGLGAVSRQEHGSDAGTATPAWPRVSRLDLGALPTAIGCARDHTRAVLAEWGLAHLEFDAALVASVLLTNALRASQALKETLNLPVPPPIVLRILANNRQLIIEAWDQWTDGYDLRRPTPDDAEHGRGLTVITAICTRWGVGRVQDHYKLVWAELEI